MFSWLSSYRSHAAKNAVSKRQRVRRCLLEQLEPRCLLTADLPPDPFGGIDWNGNGLGGGLPGSGDGDGYSTYGPPEALWISSTADAMEGGPDGWFQVSRSNETPAMTVTYEIMPNSSAIPGEDFAALVGTFDFEAGQETFNLVVQPINDLFPEDAETVQIRLTGSSRPAAVDTNTDVATSEISDDDSASGVPVVTVSGTLNASEGGTNGEFRLRRSGTTSASLAVQFRITSGPGVTYGNDYTLAGAALGSFDPDTRLGSVNFMAGASSAAINVISVDDTTIEGIEYFDVKVVGGSISTYTADTTARSVVIFDNEQLHPIPSLTQVGLLSDTGSSDSDRITYDQHLSVSLQGVLAAGNYIKAEFDHDGDFEPEGTLTLNQSPTDFIYDPIAFDAALAQRLGGVSIRYRTRLFYSNNQLVGTSDWKTFSYVVEQDPSLGPMRIDPIRLKKDTNIANDGITANPILVGRVLGDFQEAAARIDFDHDNDGIADASTEVAVTGGRFEYDPRIAEPSLESHVGPVTLRYRLVEVRSSDVNGPWEPFQFTLLPTPTSTYTVVDVSHDVGRGSDDEYDYGTYGLIFSGRVNSGGEAGPQFGDKPPGDTPSVYGGGTSDGGSPFDPGYGSGTTEPGGSGGLEPGNDSGGGNGGNDDDDDDDDDDFSPPLPQAVRIQVDHDEDGVVDGETTTDSNLAFDYFPTNVSVGTHTFRFRAIQWSVDYGMYLFGPWTAYTFTYLPNPAPAIASLALRNDTGEFNSDKITADPTFIGRLVVPIFNPASTRVEFDLNSDSQPDAEVFVSDEGFFQYTAASLSAGAHTIHVRSTAYDIVVGAEALGDWVSFQLVYEPIAAATTTLELLVDNGESDSDAITSIGTLTGIVSPPEGHSIRVAIDTNDDRVIDGYAIPQSDGQFVYRPTGLALGVTVMAAQVYRFNPYLDIEEAGPWTELSFTLVPPSSLPLSLDNLRLVFDTGTNSSDRITTSPTLAAEVLGAAIADNVEIDLDGNGTVDATSPIRTDGSFRFTPIGLSLGIHVISARAVGYDYTTGIRTEGTWSSLDFTLVSSTASTPIIETLSLLSDSGVDGDSITENTSILGTIIDDGSVNRVTIQVDFNGDGNADETIFTDSTAFSSITR